MTDNIADAKLRIEDLNFYHGRFRALESLSLSVLERRVTAFIGPSGCGKSAPPRSINRIYELYPGQRATGAIILDGDNILDGRQDITGLRAKIGMVFQIRGARRQVMGIGGIGIVLQERVVETVDRRGVVMGVKRGSPAGYAAK